MKSNGYLDMPGCARISTYADPVTGERLLDWRDLCLAAGYHLTPDRWKEVPSGEKREIGIKMLVSAKGAEKLLEGVKDDRGTRLLEGVRLAFRNEIPTATLTEPELNGRTAPEEGECTFTDAEIGTLRAVNLEGKAWFSARDAARLVGYGLKSSASTVLLNSRRKLLEGHTRTESVMLPGTRIKQDKLLIDAEGIESLSLARRGSEFHSKVSRWLNDEVLPEMLRIYRESTTAIRVAATSVPPEKASLLEEKIRELQEANTSLLRELESLDGERERSEMENAALRRKVESLDVEMGSSGMENAALSHEVESLREERESLEAENNFLSRRKGELEEANAALLEELAALREENADLRGKVIDMQRVKVTQVDWRGTFRMKGGLLPSIASLEGELSGFCAANGWAVGSSGGAMTFPKAAVEGYLEHYRAHPEIFSKWR